jgi:hypothetical protein
LSVVFFNFLFLHKNLKKYFYFFFIFLPFNLVSPKHSAFNLAILILSIKYIQLYLNFSYYWSKCIRHTSCVHTHTSNSFSFSVISFLDRITLCNKIFREWKLTQIFLHQNSFNRTFLPHSMSLKIQRKLISQCTHEIKWESFHKSIICAY